MTRCPYRADKECNEIEMNHVDGYKYCNVCLLGQISDNSDMLITAIGNLTASLEESKMEAIHKEEYE